MEQIRLDLHAYYYLLLAVALTSWLAANCQAQQTALVAIDHLAAKFKYSTLAWPKPIRHLELLESCTARNNSFNRRFSAAGS